MTISASKVNRSIWVGNAVYKLKKAQSPETTALARYLLLQYASQPNFSAALAINNLAQAESQFNALYSVNPNIQKGNGRGDFDSINSMYAILANIPSVSIRTAVGSEQLNWARPDFRISLQPQELLLQQAGQYFSYTRLASYRTNTIQQLYDLAQKNMSVAAVVNTFFGPTFNASISDTAKLIASNNTDFAAGSVATKIIGNLDNVGNLIGVDFHQTAADQLNSIKQASDNALSILGTIDALQSKFTDFMNDPIAQNMVSGWASGEQAQDGAILDTASSGIYLLSSLCGASGNATLSDFGTKIAAIGNAAAEIAGSISTVVQQASDFINTVAEIGDIGMSLMTGDIFGAALDAFGMFGGSGPSQDAQVLQGLQDIKNQIAGLQQNMNARFDRIDQKLDQIYTTMTNYFNTTYQMIGDLQRTADDIRLQVGEIRTDLFTFQSNLDRLQVNMYNLISASNHNDLYQQINYIINYKINNPASNPLSYKDFYTYYNDFYNFGTSTSFSAPEVAGDVPGGTPPNTRAFDDKSLVKELTSFPLEDNVDYLLRLYIGAANASSSHPQLPTLTSSDIVPNPRDWELSSEAILRLFSDWPANYKAMSSLPGWQPSALTFPQGTLYAVEDVGKRLQADIGKITLVNGNPNTQLFGFLKGKYSQNFQAFQNEAASESAQILKTNNISSGLQLYDPCDTSGYTVTHSTWFLSQPQYTNGSFGVWTYQPFFGDTSFIPYYYKLLEMMHVGWIQYYIYVNDGLTDPNNENSHAFQFIVYAQFENSGFTPGTGFSDRHLNPTTYFGHGGETVIASKGVRYSTGGFVDPVSYYNSNFGQIWSDFNNSNNVGYGWYDPNNSPLNYDNSNEVYDEESNRLVNLQKADCANVLTNLHAVGPLSDAALALDGTKELTKSYIALGLSRTLESSDLLRSLLYGSQSLVDRSQVEDSYINALSYLQQTNTAIYYNPFDKAALDEYSRLSTLFDTVISSRLTQIGQTGRTEPQKLVDTALNRIKVYERIGQLNAMAGSSLKLSTSTVSGGDSLSGTVTLPNPAPAGGATFALTSASSSVILPPTVTVPAGYSQVTFTIGTTAPPSLQSTTVQATMDVSSVAPLTVLPPKVVKVYPFPVKPIPGGTLCYLVIYLDHKAGPSGETVNLVSDHPEVMSVPTTVKIPPGLQYRAFNIPAAGVDATTTVHISANITGTPATVGVVNVVPVSSIGKVYVVPSGPVIGGNKASLALDLVGKAGPSGVKVTLSSSAPNAAINAPIILTIPAGATSLTYSIPTYGVDSPVSVTLQAKVGNGPVTTGSLLVNPANAITSVYSFPKGTPVIGGNPMEIVVYLNGAAGPSGQSALVASNNHDVVLKTPVVVNIPPGAKSSYVKVPTSTVMSSTVVTLTATLSGGPSTSGTVTVVPK